MSEVPAHFSSDGYEEIIADLKNKNKNPLPTHEIVQKAFGQQGVNG